MGSLTTIQNYITLKRVSRADVFSLQLDHHSELHHSQTHNLPRFRFPLLDHHSELHHSQTRSVWKDAQVMLDHHSELHHSQTKP